MYIYLCERREELTWTALRLSLMCMRSISSGTTASDLRYCMRPSGCTHTHTHTHTHNVIDEQAHCFPVTCIYAHIYVHMLYVALSPTMYSVIFRRCALMQSLINTLTHITCSYIYSEHSSSKAQSTRSDVYVPGLCGGEHWQLDFL